MKTFVLFIFIYTGSYRGGVAISTQEFDTQSACNTAQSEFMRIMQTSYDDDRLRVETNWAAWCASKSSVVN